MDIALQWCEESLMAFWKRYFNFSKDTSCASFWLNILIYLIICPKLLTIFPQVQHFFYWIIAVPIFSMTCRRWHDAGINSCFLLIFISIYSVLSFHLRFFPMTVMGLICTQAVYVLMCFISLIILVAPKNKAPAMLLGCYKVFKFIYRILLLIFLSTAIFVKELLSLVINNFK